MPEPISTIFDAL